MGLHQAVSSPGIRRWRRDGGGWGAITKPWAGGCHPLYTMVAPNPARASREDAPGRCQPSSAPRRDPRQRLWAGGAGEASWAGTCQDRSGAAAAGAGGGERHLGTHERRRSAWHPVPGTMPDGCSEWAVLSPQPHTECNECSVLSARSPPLPTQPCTTCFSSSSDEGKPSPAIPSPPLPRAGNQGAPLLSRSSGAGGKESWGGVPWGDPPLPGPLPPPMGRWDPLHYQAANWGRGMRPSTRMGTRAGTPSSHPTSCGVSPGLRTG